MIINDNSIRTLQELDRKKLEVRVVEDVPDKLTDVFTMVYNRKNRCLFACDTKNWIKFEGKIL